MPRFSERFAVPPDIIMGGKFLARLPSFLRNPVSLNEAEETLRLRLENRESYFLFLLKNTIYSHPSNPYRKMLDLAGCEYGDLEKLVRKEGIEQTLKELFHNGIFLSVNEYKGRTPVIRGTTKFNVSPLLLSNPLINPHLRTHSSGSSSKNIIVPLDLAFVRERSIDHRLLIEARGGSQWNCAVWGVPGNTDIVRVLELHCSGFHNIQWFSQVKQNAPGLHPRYRWSTRAIRWAAILTRKEQPSPQFVPLNDPSPIVHWIREILDKGETPHITTWVSTALRICQAASSLRIDISGTQFTVGGEPLTIARQAMIQKSGAVAVPRFMSVETAYMGYGCLNPEHIDDYHSINDFTAIIQAGKEGEKYGLPPEALLVTSIRPTAPLILLNVSLGDQAELEKRDCGCPLDKLGWKNHLHSVRSFEKLTSSGMTFLDSDIMHVLEEVLPSRIGGTPLDYQLVEDETEGGNPRILLLVNPDLGPVNTEDVLHTFLQAIGKGSGAEKVMSLQWKSSGMISVQRERPRTTKTGKIFHVLRSKK
jgi:hypothetical protein